MYALFERVDTRLTELFVFDWMLTESKLNFSFHVNYYSLSWWYFVNQSSTQAELIVYIICQLTQINFRLFTSRPYEFFFIVTIDLLQQLKT